MKITTLTLPAFDPLLLLCRLDDKQCLPAFARVNDWTVVTWNPSSTIVSHGEKNAWSKLQAAIDRRRRIVDSRLPFTGGLIGYFSYDAGYELVDIKKTVKDDLRLPQFCFHEYDNAVLFDGKRVHIVGDHAFVDEVREIHARSLLPAGDLSVAFGPDIGRGEYDKAFARIRKAIIDGDIYQMNYAYRFSAKSTVDRRRLFASLMHKNPAARASYVESDECSLLSLSPEHFLTVDKHRIWTSPIKGTRPRGATRTDDLRLRRELENSPKERAELNMIVDLMRNDLGRVCDVGSVRVKEHRVIQANPTVWHTYSVIEGRIDRQTSVTDIFKALLPGGSVTGCPKRRAMQYIDGLEASARGPYTGSFALLSDHGRVESSILIRTLISVEDRLHLHVGGGIVFDSDAESEWDETLAKAGSFLSMTAGADRNPRKRKVSISINGKSPPKNDPRIAFLNPAHQGAKTVFETLRTYDGKIFALDEHLERLEKSASLIGIILPRSPEVISSWLTQLYEKSDIGTARLKIVATAADIILSCAELHVDPRDTAGIAVALVPLERHTPEAKATPYGFSVAAHEWARSKDCREALLVNRHGKVTEGAYSNLFWVEDGVLWTPGSDVLKGITRAHVIRIAQESKIPVRFALPSVTRLMKADEVFVTRTTVGISPVIRVDATRIGSGKIGTVTKKIIRRFEKTVGKSRE